MKYKTDQLFICKTKGDIMTTIIELVYNFLWGDLVTLPLPGGGTLGLPLLVILLIPTGIYFTIRTKFLPIRLFPDMVRALNEKKDKRGGLSSFQTLIVSTATRVGMGNLVGVVAAISAGGAGAVFWMWITALLGSSTAFIEGTLAQLHKEKDPLYGGYHGGPAYYMHHFFAKRKDGTYRKYSVLAVLFAISGLICWCGISQVISNSVTSAFENAFSIPPLATTIILVVLAAIIVLRKNATVKVWTSWFRSWHVHTLFLLSLSFLHTSDRCRTFLHVFSRKHLVSAKSQPAVSVLY